MSQLSTVSGGARIGRTWVTPDTVSRPTRRMPNPLLGCTVVRRVTDDRGREWRVRQLWSAVGHALLFQSAVRGLRSEARSAPAPLDSLSEDELVTLLESAAE